MRAKRYSSPGGRERFPKGSPAPEGYCAWHEWAEDQTYYGLKQSWCGTCKTYLFPQEYCEHLKGAKS